MGEWMSGSDAAWLHMDRPTNRMIVQTVLCFDQPLDPDRLTRLVQQRWVDWYPRLRQRVQETPVPFGPLALPRWVEVRDVRAEQHVVQARLTPPGDARALHAYLEELAPRPLNPSRPLWELHLLHGFGHGSALLLRTHHAVADGLALMHLLQALTDEGVDEPTSRNTDGPRDVRWLGDRGRLLATRAVQTLSDPDRLRASVAVLRAQNAAWRRLGLVQQDRGSSLRRQPGTAKSVRWTDIVDVRDVREAARQSGGSVNDLLLATIAGALRAYLAGRGEHPETLGAVVPFNVRSMDKPMPRTLGNKFGLVFVHLPVGTAAPAERIAASKVEMDAIKQSRQGWVTFGGLSSAGTMPARLDRAFVDRYAGMGSLIVTNVPGPARPLTIAGVDVADLLFWVPATGPIGLGISIVSYAGRLRLGVLADREAVPDPDELTDALNRELAGLLPLAAAT